MADAKKFMTKSQHTKITPQVIKDHGLTVEEYERIVNSIKREPNITELGIFSVMWSEHCSYKSSKIYLKTFPTQGPAILQGPGENAGIINIGDGLALSFKMESHNHPSFIEPYQGAATGVGGILRDIFTMGARPIANLNSLKFGGPVHPRTAYLLNGVVAGIGGYGNTMGIPTVGGEVYFDECYNGNILVNAFTVGIMSAAKIFRGQAKGIGNPVIYVGSKTGRDGIHGATMASGEFDETTEEKRPTVQVGDPFTEKLLLEACLELMEGDAVVGIQDMGAAGLTCGAFEMADRAGLGMEVDLDKVPKREEGMTSYEIMLSESQERMIIVARQGREDDVRKIFEKWDLDVAVIGRVTDSDRVKIFKNGEKVVDLPVAPVVREAPVYERAVAEPEYLKQTRSENIDNLPLPRDFNEILLKMMGHPNLGSRQWVWRQYDHMVMTNTVVLPGSDAAVLRIKDTKKAIALTLDSNGRYCYLDPYAGGVLVVAEAARNLTCSGAVPLAITDCLNFASPEKPEVMWQFKQAVRGISDACIKFNTPVTGGNVSFYNETNGVPIYPTPSIGMVGLIEDVSFHCTQWWKDEGDAILLIGKNSSDIGGSEYLKQIHNLVAGRPPYLDFDRELAVQSACRTGIRRGFIKSAHDVSDGGLAVALLECSLSRGKGLIGSKIDLDDEIRHDALLFGEAPSRIIVSVAPGDVEKMCRIAHECGAPVKKIGEVGGNKLQMNNLIGLDLMDVYLKWRDAIPSIFGKE